MKKYYNDAKYNVAFDRCINTMSKLMQKYGYQVLDKQKNKTGNNSNET